MSLEQVESILTTGFNPVFLDVVDESHKHSFKSDVPTHLKIVVVSLEFEGMPLLRRHRMVNDKIKLFVSGMRAVSLSTLAPSEWESIGSVDLHKSPNCKGSS